MKRNLLNLSVIAVALLTFSCTESVKNDEFSSRRERVVDANGSAVAIIDSKPAYGEVNNQFYYLTGVVDDSAVLMFGGKDGKNGYIFSDKQHTNLPEGIELLKSDLLDDYIAKNSGNNSSFQLISIDEEKFTEKYLKDMTITSGLDSIISNMRVYKDSIEIAYTRKACINTALGIKKMMQEIKVGDKEEKMAKIMTDEFARLGSDSISFIQTAAGENATAIHAGVTEYELQDGDISVIDIGATIDRYTADISRTFPVNGKFTKEQKEIYSLVLEAQKAGQADLKPGSTFKKSHQIAEDIMINGLAKLGLLTDVNSPWQRKFYIVHGFSHFVGLDIHDVISWYRTNVPAEKQIYEPSMILTFEPGLYFPSNYIDEFVAKAPERGIDPKELAAFVKAVGPVYNKYKGIGVRIENCILITETGGEVLTGDVPVEVEDIEALMK